MAMRYQKYAKHNFRTISEFIEIDLSPLSCFGTLLSRVGQAGVG